MDRPFSPDYRTARLRFRESVRRAGGNARVTAADGPRTRRRKPHDRCGMGTALLSAGLLAVDVTLVVPARSDSVLVRYASVAHFDDLMSAGVNIGLFNRGLLHTKSLAIDDTISVFRFLRSRIRDRRRCFPRRRSGIAARGRQSRRGDPGPRHASAPDRVCLRPARRAGSPAVRRLR